MTKEQTLEKIAEKSGVSYRTLQRWIHEGIIKIGGYAPGKNPHRNRIRVSARDERALLLLAKVFTYLNREEMAALMKRLEGYQSDPLEGMEAILLVRGKDGSHKMQARYRDRKQACRDAMEVKGTAIIVGLK